MVVGAASGRKDGPGRTRSAFSNASGIRPHTPELVGLPPAAPRDFSHVPRHCLANFGRIDDFIRLCVAWTPHLRVHHRRLRVLQLLLVTRPGAGVMARRGTHRFRIDGHTDAVHSIQAIWGRRRAEEHYAADFIATDDPAAMANMPNSCSPTSMLTGRCGPNTTSSATTGIRRYSATTRTWRCRGDGPQGEGDDLHRQNPPPRSRQARASGS